MRRSRLVRIGLMILAVVVVLSGIWWLFIDSPHVTDTELRATTPDPTVSEAPQEFTMTVRARSRSANWTAGVLYNGNSRERLGWVHSTGPDSTVTITHYQRLVGNHTANFIRYHNSDGEAFTKRVGSIRIDLDNETEILRVDNDSQTYKYYRQGEGSEFEIIPELIPPLGFIQTIPFQSDGPTLYNGDEVEGYAPVDGWTEPAGSVPDDKPDMYLSNTSGKLYVEKESGDIVHVDVSLTSIRTDTRAGRWFGAKGTRAHFTLTVREKLSETGIAPGWVEAEPFEGR